VTGDLGRLIPALRRLRWHGRWYVITRDQAYQLFIILNELLLGVETGLAHISNGTLRPYEWVPILFGPLAACGLTIAYVGLRRARAWAPWLMVVLLLGSIGVGAMGTYLHVARSLRPFALPGERLTLELIVWGVPLLAPPSFALVGVLGLVTLAHLPTEQKSVLYFLLSSMGVAIAAVSGVIDHLRGGFANPWLWIPTVTGIFGVIVAFALSLVHTRTRGDLVVYGLGMLALIVVGPLGVALHIRHDLGVGNAIVIERFLRYAPVLAPMVFANMGLMGLLALLGDRDATLAHTKV
jgi:hypothetical protein